MAMADAYNNRGKTSLFSHDRGLKSYKKYEEKLKDTLIAFSMESSINSVSAFKNKINSPLAKLIPSLFAFEKPALYPKSFHIVVGNSFSTSVFFPSSKELSITITS